MAKTENDTCWFLDAVEHPEAHHFFLGLDPSLTGTGLAVIVTDLWDSVVAIASTTVKTKSSTPMLERLAEIYDAVTGVMQPEFEPYITNAAIEDLPIGARGAGLTGMAQGVVRLALYDRGAHDGQLLSISPASLKKWAVGSGRATKEEMIAGIVRRYGNMVKPKDDNQADAIWLAKLAMDAKVNHDTLEGVSYKVVGPLD